MFFKRYLFFVLIFVFCDGVNASNNNGNNIGSRNRPLDIVFCLDLSGSTNGLINDVREQLWTIVNQAHKMEPTPGLRIGIVGFSRPSFGKDNAYVKVLSYLTNDFDSLAYELYKLKPSIEQGDQYVNAALNTAMDNINWGKEKNNVKIIFIVGNGMASIRGVDLEGTGEKLVKRKIIVNSLFVLSKGNGKSQAMSGWKRIAEITNGIQSEIVIGKSEMVTDLTMNFNSLLNLNRELNQTYFYYGPSGKINYRRLNDLDSALYLSGLPNYYQRVWYKLSPRFQNTQQSWDMVDYIKSADGDLDRLDIRTLADSLQFYSTIDLKELLLSQKDKRNKVLLDINRLYQNNFVDTQHKMFTNNEFPDSNIFSRCVINMLLKEWK